MEVEYELTPDDLYHFHWRAGTRSPSVKRAKLGAYLSVIFLFSLLTVLSGLGSEGFEFSRASWMWIVWIFPVAAAMWILEKQQMRRAILGLVKEEQPGRGQLGSHKISLNDAGLVESTAVGESRTSWAGVDRVEHDEKYIYIYTAPHAAHVVPKRAFRSPQEAESFYQASRIKTIAASPARTIS